MCKHDKAHLTSHCVNFPISTVTNDNKFSGCYPIVFVGTVAWQRIKLRSPEVAILFGESRGDGPYEAVALSLMMVEEVTWNGRSSIALNWKTQPRQSNKANALMMGRLPIQTFCVAGMKSQHHCIMKKIKQLQFLIMLA